MRYHGDPERNQPGGGKRPSRRTTKESPMNDSKWSKRFWADLAERVGATFLGAVLTYITVDNILERPDFEQLWVILVVPTLVSLIKGLLANMANGESGASALPAPPGPEVQPDVDHFRNELGESALHLALVVLVVLVIVFVVLGFVR